MNDTARFAFGANWKRLKITDERINGALASMRKLFPAGLKGKCFLDIGCGSGLFSLAATMLGARVQSFDFDPQCVDCTNELRLRHAPDANWIVEQGSILDRDYIARLGTFDVVYSWGVLHHTGNLWKACENAAELVRINGHLVVSIYNDQGWRSRYWEYVKRQYCVRPALRAVIIGVHLPMLAARVLSRIVRRDLVLSRGMSFWRDHVDWVGGYPFEVATPDQVRRLFHEFTLIQFCPATSGCNEFVFVRLPG